MRSSSRTQSTFSGVENSGLNRVNLRNLGSNRTLVLIDGQRVVSSHVTGITDVSQFPQLLIKRVDVVTGGASASWGSDAVAGVVNFVTDTRFSGFKANVAGGTSTYGDDQSALIQLAGGFSALDDRLHVEFSGEYFDNQGVPGGNIGGGQPVELGQMLLARQHQLGRGQRRAAGTHHAGRSGIGAPVGLRIAQALNETKGVGIAAGQRTVRPDHDGVGRADALCQWFQVVHDGHGRYLVRDGQVAAGKAQYRQGAQGLLDLLGLHRQQHIGTAQAVLGDPMVVQDGGTGMGDGPSHHAGKSVRLFVGHERSAG